MVDRAKGPGTRCYTRFEVFQGVEKAVAKRSEDHAPAQACPARLGEVDLSDELYHQLKQIARYRLQGMRPGATLNCTALVHEAFLKISRGEPAGPNSEDHLLALASLAMRQILVDAARRKQTDKRGGGAIHVTLQESAVEADGNLFDLLELDDALARLAERDPELEKLVVLRFFAGLTMEQVSRVLDQSIRTTERDWTRARVYLYRALRRDES